MRVLCQKWASIWMSTWGECTYGARGLLPIGAKYYEDNHGCVKVGGCNLGSFCCFWDLIIQRECNVDVVLVV